MISAQARLLIPRTIRFGLIILLLGGMALGPRSVQAAQDFVHGPGWIVVASQTTVDKDPEYGSITYNDIYTVNTITHRKYGPFLRNELTPPDEITGRPSGGGDLYDVAMTPDGKTALISSFGNHWVHIIDVSDPLHPAFTATVEIDIFAEDIAITADGRYAVVTDGGFSQNAFVIDILNHVVISEVLLPIYDHAANGDPINGYTNAVAIAPDGTVLMADYFGGAMHALTIDAAGRLTYHGTYRYYISHDGETSLTPDAAPSGGPDRAARVSPENTTFASSAAFSSSDDVEYFPIRPVNVAIAPDGQTVLLSDVSAYQDPDLEQYTRLFNVGVYRITEPGTLEFVEAVAGLPRAMQTITFNETGDLAIMSGNAGMSHDSTVVPAETELMDGLYFMKINGPGDVEFDTVNSVELGRYTSSQLFGVDGLAVYDGKAYVTYPTLSMSSTDYPMRFISVIDLETFQLSLIAWGLSNNKVPTGLGIRPYIPERYFIPALFGE